MDKTKQWGIAAGAAVLAVVVGGWFLLISPQRSTASDLRSQAATQEQDNHTLEQRIAALKAQHKDLPATQAALAKLAVQMPANPALPALIRQLSSGADSAGVELVSLAPSEPKFVETAPVAPTSSAASTTASDSASTSTTPAQPVVSNRSRLAYVPIEIVVNGSYFQLEQFLSNLEANKRSFLTTQIDAVPGEPERPDSTDAAAPGAASVEGSSTEYHGHLEATITGRVFMNVAPATATTSSTAPAAAK